MMKWPCRLFILFLVLNPLFLPAQEKGGSLTSKGYLKFLQTSFYQDFDEVWYIDNLVHNRLNFRWYADSHFNIGLEMRNRFFYGDFVKTIPDYGEMMDHNSGYFDLSWNLAEGQSYLLNTTIDRMYADIILGKLQIRAGRHRVNWSQNMMWNVNDIFNAYSYFDFDYEERPGTDGVKVQYYTGLTSSAEVVYEMADSLESMAFAGLYRFNTFGYDFQFLGGYVKNDWVAGAGWSGDIKGGGFRGEVSYFYAHDDTVKNRSQLMASLSGDYTFKNSLFISTGIIFNNRGSTGKAPFPESLFFSNLSAKNLTPARAEIFAQVSYPFTPLINGSFAGILNPFDQSYFFGPSFAISLMDNLELMLIGQFFAGEDGTEYGDIGKLLYWRLKWSF